MKTPAVRRVAARALGRQPGAKESAVAPLANALSDSDLEVRELAAESLGRIGLDAKSALASLTSALKDSEPSVRIAAALAIQKIDPLATSYQPVVIDALRAGNGPVFLAVGQMGGDIQLGDSNAHGPFVRSSQPNSSASSSRIRLIRAARKRCRTSSAPLLARLRTVCP